MFYDALNILDCIASNDWVNDGAELEKFPKTVVVELSK
jgi:hypothetical protein